MKSQKNKENLKSKKVMKNLISCETCIKKDVCADLKEIVAHQNQELLVTDCLFYFPKIICVGKNGEKLNIRKGSKIYTEPHNIPENK